jgi:hypothetical protein
MPLNVGASMGSEAYATASAENAYDNAYSNVTTTPEYFNNGGGKNTFRYPMKRIDSTSDYLEIKIFDYIAGGIDFGPPLEIPSLQQRQQQNKAGKSSPTHYIILPIPQNVSDSNSVTWGEDRLDPMSAAGVGIFGEGVTSPTQAAQKIIEAAGSYSTQLANNEALKKAFISKLAGESVNNLGGNVSTSGLIARTTGMVMNSNLELLFQGINLRGFQFTFDLAPRSRKEAEEVKGIIRTLKSTMSARNGGAGTGNNRSGFFIDSPSVYQLTYKMGPKKHPFLNTFKPCALTDMSVNYTASGTYATYEDGSPVHLQMSLVFKEIDPVYYEDYGQEEAADGVGY